MATDWKDIPGDTKEKYGLYLCSREWAELKRAVHERAGGKCERCRRNPIDAVHHLTYDRKYAERLEDLQANCDGCHAFTHGKSDIDPSPVSSIVVSPDWHSVYIEDETGKRFLGLNYFSCVEESARFSNGTVNCMGDKVSEDGFQISIKISGGDHDKCKLFHAIVDFSEEDKKRIAEWLIRSTIKGEL